VGGGLPPRRAWIRCRSAGGALGDLGEDLGVEREVHQHGHGERGTKHPAAASDSIRARP
jgi:hypothetical protein